MPKTRANNKPQLQLPLVKAAVKPILPTPYRAWPRLKVVKQPEKVPVGDLVRPLLKAKVVPRRQPVPVAL